MRILKTHAQFTKCNWNMQNIGQEYNNINGITSNGCDLYVRRWYAESSNSGLLPPSQSMVAITGRRPLGYISIDQLLPDRKHNNVLDHYSTQLNEI